MHALVYRVTLLDEKRAHEGLHESVVPATEAGPGFVAGYWVQLGPDKGCAVLVYDSEENARAALESGDSAPPDVVRIESRELGEVRATAGQPAGAR